MKNSPSVINVVAICMVVVINWSCSKENRWDCAKRTGKPDTDIRILPPFTKIRTRDNIDVFITQGNTQEVKVETGSHLISLIKTEVDSGILEIRNDNKCNWARSYKNGTIKVYVTMPVLRFLWNYGSGNVKSENLLICDTLEVWAHQTGNVELTLNANVTYDNMNTTSDVTFHGKTGLFGIYHAGEGFIHCEDFLSDYCWTYSKASGDEYLNVQAELSAIIAWEGSVYYSGNATAARDGSGKGKLIQQK